MIIYTEKGAEKHWKERMDEVPKLRQSLQKDLS